MEHILVKLNNHSRPVKNTIKKLVKLRTFKRSTTSLPFRQLRSLNKLAEINECQGRENELPKEQERHVKSIDTRSMSPFSQIKHDVEKFRMTFSSKCDGFLRNGKQPAKVQFGPDSQGPAQKAKKDRNISRNDSRVNSPATRGLVKHLKKKVSKVSKFQHSMVTPPSCDLYEDQLDEIPEDGFPRNDSNSKSLKRFPNITTQNRKTKFQLKPVFEKDRNSLDLRRELLSVTVKLKKMSEVQNILIQRSSEVKNKDLYFSPRTTKTSLISQIKSSKMSRFSNARTNYSSIISTKKGICKSPNPRSFMSLNPISCNFTSHRKELSQLEEVFSTPKEYYGGSRQPQKFLSPDNIRLKRYLNQKNEQNTRGRLKKMFQVGAKRPRNFKNRRRMRI
ncbi:unnamed protein product [Moneuplotes crassus]|uniref:Uncharacterized protein n=1 Tax=Euplotes crassus TaxID=5936 RepID=A0AAD1U6Y8_EUPCR|nr:unnamed protein product [Moneuplotes crassus]